MAIEDIFPLSLEEFKSGYWRKACVVSEGSRGRFSSLFDLPRFLAACRAHRRFDVVENGRHSPWVSSEPELFAARGMPLVLMDVQNKVGPVADLCAELAVELGLDGPAHVNSYYNPRPGKGLGAHRDMEDNFILHIAGRKHWRVLAAPAPGRKPRMLDFVLKPGDALYLPYGVPHQADSRSAGSLHLTFGFYPPKPGGAEKPKILRVRDAVRRSIRRPGWPPPPRALRAPAPALRLHRGVGGAFGSDGRERIYLTARLRRLAIPPRLSAWAGRLLREPSFFVGRALEKLPVRDREPGRALIARGVSEGVWSPRPSPLSAG